MPWNEWIPQEFCCYVYLKDNYLILTQLQITFQKANTIVRNFIKQNTKYLDLLKSYLVKNAKSMNIFMLLYIQHFIHVITSLVQKIDQSLNYAI